MGGGPDKDILLITLFGPKPTQTIAEIKRRFPYIEVIYVDVTDEDHPDLNELFRTATILVTLSVLPAKAEDAPNLTLIHLFSAGVDFWLNHPIFKDSDIPITTSSGIHGPPISEWIIMTALASSKHFSILYEQQKQHVWGRQLPPTTDWVGKRIGIAGYGSIGRQVAKVFTAMGAQVIAYTASPKSTPEARRDSGYAIPGTGDPKGEYPIAWFSGTSKEALHTFLSAKLDCLVISLPLTPATTHLFSTQEFEILRKANPNRGCSLVNIARGKIVDQPALVRALNDGVLSGAAIDTTDPEPLPPDDPLWDAKNVIVTPHISANGVEYVSRAYDLFMTNLERREEGKELFNLVNRKKGY